MENNKNIDVLIAGFLTGSLCEDELAELNHWLDEDALHYVEFNRMRSAWIMAGYEAGKKRFDTQRGWMDMEPHVRAKPAYQHSIHRPQQKRTVRLRIPHLAAMLAVVFALGMVVYSHTAHKAEMETAWYETMAPLGTKSQITLIDGTKVWLNAGSTLRYSTDFGLHNREVRLEGEAYFEVARNAALPFDVKTSQLKVRAIGTAFNVKDYPDEPTIETILVDGAVEVLPIEEAATGKSNTVVLQPNERLILKKKTNKMVVETEVGKTEKMEQMPQPVAQKDMPMQASAMQKVETTDNLMVHTSWKDRRWRIESEELGSFVIKLERRYNVIIKFDDHDLAAYRFSGTFEEEPVEEVLRALEFAAPVKFTLKGNLVTLSRNNAFREAYQNLYVR